MATAPPGYLTINEAAKELGVSPWRVVELADSQELVSVRLIEVASLLGFKESTPLSVVRTDGVTSVEPGCTCGGMAACPQCQERDAADDRTHAIPPIPARMLSKEAFRD